MNAMTPVKALEVRGFATEGQASRMLMLITNVAQVFKIPEDRMADLRLLALSHDIGKAAIPGRILFKPGPLTE